MCLLPYHIHTPSLLPLPTYPLSFGLVVLSPFLLSFPIPHFVCGLSSLYGRGRIMILEEKKVVLSFAAGKLSGV